MKPFVGHQRKNLTVWRQDLRGRYQMNNKLLTTWKIIKMLGPIIMLNKISRLPLTANIVKAKLHRLTTHTHMSTTKPTSRDASARRALWRAPAWSVVRGGRRERSAHLFIRAIPASLPKKSAPGTAFFIWKLFWKNTVKTREADFTSMFVLAPFPWIYSRTHMI